MTATDRSGIRTEIVHRVHTFRHHPLLQHRFAHGYVEETYARSRATPKKLTLFFVGFRDLSEWRTRH